MLLSKLARLERHRHRRSKTNPKVQNMAPPEVWHPAVSADYARSLEQIRAALTVEDGQARALARQQASADVAHYRQQLEAAKDEPPEIVAYFARGLEGAEYVAQREGV